MDENLPEEYRIELAKAFVNDLFSKVASDVASIVGFEGPKVLAVASGRESRVNDLCVVRFLHPLLILTSSVSPTDSYFLPYSVHSSSSPFRFPLFQPPPPAPRIPSLLLTCFFSLSSPEAPLFPPSILPTISPTHPLYSPGYFIFSVSFPVSNELLLFRQIPFLTHISSRVRAGFAAEVCSALSLPISSHGLSCLFSSHHFFSPLPHIRGPDCFTSHADTQPFISCWKSPHLQLGSLDPTHPCKPFLSACWFRVTAIIGMSNFGWLHGPLPSCCSRRRLSTLPQDQSSATSESRQTD
jgi:hypothetical protein